MLVVRVTASQAIAKGRLSILRCGDFYRVFYVYLTSRCPSKCARRSTRLGSQCTRNRPNTRGTRDATWDRDCLEHPHSVQTGPRRLLCIVSTSDGFPNRGLLSHESPARAIARKVPCNVVYSLSVDRKSTRLNSSHSGESRMPSSA